MSVNDYFWKRSHYDQVGKTKRNFGKYGGQYSHILLFSKHSDPRNLDGRQYTETKFMVIIIVSKLLTLKKHLPKWQHNYHL